MQVGGGHSLNANSVLGKLNTFLKTENLNFKLNKNMLKIKFWLTSSLFRSKIRMPETSQIPAITKCGI